MDEIIKNISIGVFTADLRGSAISFNNAFLEIFGFPSQAHAEKFNIFEDTALRVIGADEEIKKVLKKETVELKLDFTATWGKRIKAKMKCLPLLSETSEVNGVACIFEDISKISALEGEAARLSSERDKAVEEVRKLDNLKKDVLMNVSHELKTPVAVIKGTTELLEESDTMDEVKKIVKTLRHGLIRLENVVDELVYASYIEIKPEKKAAIKEVIKNAVEKAKPLSKEKNIKIRVMVQEEIPPIKIDDSAVSHALYCLINNGIKFNKTGGEVLVEAAKKGNEIEIVVSDNGIGISKENLEKLFTPLYQVEQQATRRYEGIGLGLANVKRVVEAHGGRIWAKSEQGAGSAFHVVLPIQ